MARTTAAVRAGAREFLVLLLKKVPGAAEVDRRLVIGQRLSAARTMSVVPVSAAGVRLSGAARSSSRLDVVADARLRQYRRYVDSGHHGRQPTGSTGVLLVARFG